MCGHGSRGAAPGAQVTAGPSRLAGWQLSYLVLAHVNNCGHATARQQQRLAMNLELLLCIGNTLIRRQRMVWGQFINRIDGAGVGGLDVDSQGVLLQGAMAATTLRASSATVIF